MCKTNIFRRFSILNRYFYVFLYSYSGYLSQSLVTSALIYSFLFSKSVAASQMHSAIFGISSSFKPLVVTAGVPMRTPEVTNGLLGSFGTVFLFKVINTSSQRFCSSLPEISIPRRSNSIRWLSVPPVRILKPCFCSASASAFAFNTT